MGITVVSASSLGLGRLDSWTSSNMQQILINSHKYFNMMLSRLSQSREQKRQVVSNVSHELCTHLTTVNGYLQSLLRRQNNLNSAQLEAL
jgi:signal transduction histidine kinase